MKRNTVLAILFGITVLAIILIFHRRDRITPPLPVESRPEKNGDPTRSQRPLPDPTRQPKTLENATTDEAIAIIEGELGNLSREERESKPEDASWQEWAHVVSVHRIMKSKNGKVTFFGKVVSAEGEPISGVSLIAKISYAESSLIKAIASREVSGEKRLSLVTDDSGRFEVRNVEGMDLLVLEFRKTGYEIAGKKKYWGYSFMPARLERHIANPSIPKIFTMKRVE